MNRIATPMTTTAAEGLPRRCFTVAELEQMVAAGILHEDERIELRKIKALADKRSGRQQDERSVFLIVLVDPVASGGLDGRVAAMERFMTDVAPLVRG